MELHEDIETVDKVISCLESERAKLVNVQKYSQATQVLQQMGEKQKEKRQLSNQLTTIQAKEVKSKSYYKNKQSNCTKSKSVSDTRSDGQKSVEAFFAKSGSTESRNLDACVPKQGSGTRVDPKVVILEDRMSWLLWKFKFRGWSRCGFRIKKLCPIHKYRSQR